MIRTAQYGFAILFVVHQQNERKRRVQMMGQIPGWSDEDADRWCEGHYRASVKAPFVNAPTFTQIKKCSFERTRVHLDGSLDDAIGKPIADCCHPSLEYRETQ